MKELLKNLLHAPVIIIGGCLAVICIVALFLSPFVVIALIMLPIRYFPENLALGYGLAFALACIVVALLGTLVNHFDDIS